jgi:hypothetical protein
MTVKELIEKLSTEDQNKRVVVDGYELGYDELHSISHICITPNPDKKDCWWVGEFEDGTPKQGDEIAILLPRR